jgi:hypothetical protein
MMKKVKSDEYLLKVYGEATVNVASIPRRVWRIKEAEQ